MIRRKELHQDAFALRPIRVVMDEFRYYEAVTFPENPWQGCELWLRRCEAFGFLAGEYAVIDILDQAGDIIQDYSISREGFNYLRQKLRFRIAE